MFTQFTSCVSDRSIKKSVSPLYTWCFIQLQSISSSLLPSCHLQHSACIAIGFILRPSRSSVELIWALYLSCMIVLILQKRLALMVSWQHIRRAKRLPLHQMSWGCNVKTIVGYLVLVFRAVDRLGPSLPFGRAIVAFDVFNHLRCSACTPSPCRGRLFRCLCLVCTRDSLSLSVALAHRRCFLANVIV